MNTPFLITSSCDHLVGAGEKRGWYFEPERPRSLHVGIQRSRLRVDTMKWMASKLAPRKYGDRVEHDVKSNVSMPAILIQVGGGAPEPVEVSGKVIEAE